MSGRYARTRKTKKGIGNPGAEFYTSEPLRHAAWCGFYIAKGNEDKAKEEKRKAFMAHEEEWKALKAEVRALKKKLKEVIDERK